EGLAGALDEVAPAVEEEGLVDGGLGVAGTEVGGVGAGVVEVVVGGRVWRGGAGAGAVGVELGSRGGCAVGDGRTIEPAAEQQADGSVGAQVRAHGGIE